MAKALSLLASCLTCEDTVVSREIRGFITPHHSRRLQIRRQSTQSTTANTAGDTRLSAGLCLCHCVNYI